MLQGRDTVVILPTGYGKSLIYQLPALLLDRPCVVVSPLIALMRDQEHSLKKRSVPVVRLDSTLKAAERRAALERIAQGGQLIVLTTPETLESAAARPALLAAQPALLCVDEAHCISEWGHDFRPAYLRLGAERRALGVPTVLALTATATPRVTADIIERLDLDDPLVLRAPPHRKNLELSVEVTPGGRKPEAAGKLIKGLPRPGIVYCSTTRAVDEIFAALTRARIPAARYHGKMTTPDRDAAQKRYMKPGRRLVMVATSAFGMGVDKPDIRYIVHYQCPGSLEQYVQEAGRAGRDGKLSKCVLLFDEKDLEIQERLSAQGRPKPVQLRRLGEALKAWAEEGRSVSTSELALSAQVPQTTTRSLCAELEQLGLLGVEDRRWVAKVPPAELARGVEDLAGRFETLRREDSRRLRAVAEYADTEGCRSAFLRRWFGEEDPPPCGICDRCREARARELGVVAARATSDALAVADGQERKTRIRKRPEPVVEEKKPAPRKKRRARRRPEQRRAQEERPERERPERERPARKRRPRKRPERKPAEEKSAAQEGPVEKKRPRRRRGGRGRKKKGPRSGGDSSSG